MTLGHNKHVLPGTEICRIRLGAAEVGEELKMETQIRAEIAFEKAGLFEGHPEIRAVPWCTTRFDPKYSGCTSWRNWLIRASYFVGLTSDSTPANRTPLLFLLAHLPYDFRRVAVGWPVRSD